MVEIVEAPSTRPDIMPEPTRPDKLPELDELGKVLLKARDTIREWGWFQNYYLDVNANPHEFPRVCVLGAANHAAGYAVDDHEGETLLFHKSVARRMGFQQSADLADWNDTEDRTQQEVEERLERAAYKI